VDKRAVNGTKTSRAGRRAPAAPYMGANTRRLRSPAVASSLARRQVWLFRADRSTGRQARTSAPKRVAAADAIGIAGSSFGGRIDAEHRQGSWPGGWSTGARQDFRDFDRVVPGPTRSRPSSRVRACREATRGCRGSEDARLADLLERLAPGCRRLVVVVQDLGERADGDASSSRQPR
jgi:hypothetical protein